MKIGELVYDSTFGMNGIIIGCGIHHGSGQPVWEVLYEDGQISDAYANEIEVIR